MSSQKSGAAAARPQAAQASAGPVPLFDVKRQRERLKGEIDARLRAVLEHGQFVSGPEVAELEAALAARAGVRHCVGVSNGTDALQIALRAERIGPGDAVFMPAFTYLATAGAAVLVGASPVFCEVRPDTFCLDAADLERRIEETAREGRLRPRAVVPVDLFGLPADYPALNEAARRRGLFVLADAAQSFGAKLAGRPVGGLAEATAVSFFPTKPLACYGDGGALFTDDDERARLWRSIRVHGIGEVRMQADRVGFTGRLDTLQAAVLLAKLEAFDAELARRERIAQAYDAGLRGWVRPPARPAGAQSAWALYTILVEERDRVAAALAAAGVQTGVYYPAPLHLQPAYAGYGRGPGSLPVAEALCRRCLSLPMHPDLTDAEIARAIDALAAAT
jgi:UDP-2-acetamido-2-deoxy-ribo-hexuluronate aminotransferase